MSLATRCPACNTSFKVVSDQLKLQRGLVKCGRCGEIFNGAEHLRYISNTGESTPTVTDPPTPSLQDFNSPPPDSGFNTQDNQAPNASTDGREYNTAESTKSETPLPTFMLTKNRYSLKRRLVWSLLVFVALLALLLQLGYRYRHEIVTFAEPRAPGIRSVVLKSCRLWPYPMDCSVQLPRHIERLRVAAAEVIETATPGLYSLSLSLRNESRLPQSYPALDVTLRDARNNIVARKVLFPEQYVSALQGSHPSVAAARAQQGLPSQAEQSFNLPVRIESDRDTPVPAKIAGYLIEIFYP